MSIEALRWVASAHHITAPVRSVLWALANKANKHPEKGTGELHVAWPSVETISLEAGVSLRTAQRALRTAAENGWIETRLRRVSSPNGATNLYVLPVSVTGTVSDIGDTQSEVSANVSTGGDTQSEVSANVTGEPKEPSNNHKEPSEGLKRRKGPDRVSLDQLYSWIDEQGWPSTTADPAKNLAREFISDMNASEWTVHGQPVQNAVWVFRGRLEKRGLLKRRSLLEQCKD